MSWFISFVEGCLDDSGVDVDGVACVQYSFFFPNSLFDRAFYAYDRFFLIRVLVEIVPLAGEEFDVDHGELLVVGCWGMA